jgi:hypothetical protein
LGPLGTLVTDSPIVPTPSDYDDGEIGGMMIVQGKPKYSEKTCPSAAFSTTNPTCCQDRRGGKPATNRLSYGTANPFSCTLCSLECWTMDKVQRISNFVWHFINSLHCSGLQVKQPPTKSMR